MSKTIQHVVIFGQADKRDALSEAARLLGDKVTVIGVARSLNELPEAYFCWPEGQRCPCCGREE